MIAVTRGRPVLKPGSKVLAYDPGVSTGWACAEVVSTPRGLDIDMLDLGQGKYGSHAATARYLYDKILTHYPDIVVAERFDLRPGNKFLADLTPVKVNAILDYLLLPVPIEYQTPAQAKTFTPDSRLKHLGYWPTGRTVGCPDADDVRDALRHLVRYCAVEARLPGLLTSVAE